MSDRRIPRRHTVIAASAMTVLLITFAAWPSTASPRSGLRPEGVWAVRLDIAVGPVPEALIGVLTLQKDSTCTLGVRSSFAGYAHDHASATGPLDEARGVVTACEWSKPGGQIDGLVRVYGLAEPGPAELSFVVAEGGRRLLLLLDGTHPGVTGTGEGFRR